MYYYARYMRKSSQPQPLHIDFSPIVGHSRLEPTHFFDDTGEQVTVRLDPRGARYDFKGGFMVVGLDTFKLLIRCNLPKDAHHVFYWLLGHGEYRNTVTDVTHARISADCGGIHQSRVSRMLTLLESADLVQRGHSRSILFLNPRFYFRGKPIEQKQACDDWDQLKQERAQAARDRMKLI